MADGHRQPAGCACADRQAVRQGGFGDQQRVISRRGKPGWQSSEDAESVMLNQRCLAVHRGDRLDRRAVGDRDCTNISLAAARSASRNEPVSTGRPTCSAAASTRARWMPGTMRPSAGRVRSTPSNTPKMFAQSVSRTLPSASVRSSCSSPARPAAVIRSSSRRRSAHLCPPSPPGSLMTCKRTAAGSGPGAASSTAHCSGPPTGVKFGGSNGVPVQSWDLHKYGSSEYVWQPANNAKQEKTDGPRRSVRPLLGPAGLSPVMADFG
jgi:hypothetical protein